MSMGQQLGSGTRPDVLAGMTPSAMNKALPGTQPGRPPQNQLQQAMAPKGIGPVAPQPIAGLQSSSGQFKAPVASPVAPQGGYGMPVQTMTNAVRNSQQNMNTNIQQGRRR
jgi:hypothetical protein